MLRGGGNLRLCRHLPRRSAYVAQPVEALPHLVAIRLVGARYRVHDVLLTHADLDRLEEGGEPALQEVRGGSDLIGRRLAEELRQDLDERIALRRLLEPAEVDGEFGKQHTTFLVCGVRPIIVAAWSGIR